MRRATKGFTLAEVLVTIGILVLLSGVLLIVVSPSQASFRVQPALVDVEQRLRAAADLLGGDLLAAGTAPVNPLFGLPLGGVVPAAFPYRLGLRRADPPGSFRPDAITILSAVPLAAAPTIDTEFQGTTGTVVLRRVAGCDLNSGSCGIASAASVLLVDPSGQWDLFGVSAVLGSAITLQPRGPTSGRRYAAGSSVVPVSVATYYLRPSEGPDGPVLARYDGSQSDLPMVDHVVALRFEYFGDPEPARPRSPPGPRGEAMTYGPSPPLLGEDDPRDSWPPGENCVVTLDGGRQAPRLRALGQADASLQPLDAASLTDGPWCPDAAAPSRFDADLLRVRKVRVTLRAEAADEALRGRDRRFFVRPGASGGGPIEVRDREMVFDIVPRTLAGGR